MFPVLALPVLLICELNGPLFLLTSKPPTTLPWRNAGEGWKGGPSDRDHFLRPAHVRGKEIRGSLSSASADERRWRWVRDVNRIVEAPFGGLLAGFDVAIKEVR